MSQDVQDELYKPLPTGVNHHCFGCSPTNSSGLQMKFFTDDRSVHSTLIVPEHLCGWKNLVHGGIITTILDEVMSWSAIYLLKRFILTKSITVDFLKPVTIGMELKAEGKVLEIRGEREAVMEGFLHNKDGDLCARATGTFALLLPETATRLGVADQRTLKSLETLFGVMKDEG